MTENAQNPKENVVPKHEDNIRVRIYSYYSTSTEYVIDDDWADGGMSVFRKSGRELIVKEAQLNYQTIRKAKEGHTKSLHSFVDSLGDGDGDGETCWNAYVVYITDMEGNIIYDAEARFSIEKERRLRDRGEREITLDYKERQRLLEALLVLHGENLCTREQYEDLVRKIEAKW